MRTCAGYRGRGHLISWARVAGNSKSIVFVRLRFLTKAPQMLACKVLPPHDSVYYSGDCFVAALQHMKHASQRALSLQSRRSRACVTSPTLSQLINNGTSWAVVYTVSSHQSNDTTAMSVYSIEISPASKVVVFQGELKKAPNLNRRGRKVTSCSQYAVLSCDLLSTPHRNGRKGSLYSEQTRFLSATSPERQHRNHPERLLILEAA